MSLMETINTDFTLALKNKDKIALNVLRMLKSSIKNRAIEMKQELDDVEILKVLKSEVKKRKESVESFEQAGRTELAEAEINELKLLQKYLPAEMSDEELRKNIQVVVDALPAEIKNNFGQAMGMVMKSLSGQADGSRINVIVKELLQK